MRLHATLSLELDEERLEEYRQELLARGEELYTDEPKIGRVKHWPGPPEEWTSLIDVIDLMEPAVGAITRVELVDVFDDTPLERNRKALVGDKGPELILPRDHRPTRLGWGKIGGLLVFAGVILAALWIAGGAHAATLEGTSRNDELYGTRISDVIKGHAGNDLLFGRRGDDALIGGPGADYFEGGRGHDFYRLGRGNDEVWTIDDRFDLVKSCGRGTDAVYMDSIDFVASNCEKRYVIGG